MPEKNSTALLTLGKQIRIKLQNDIGMYFYSDMQQNCLYTI